MEDSRGFCCSECGFPWISLLILLVCSSPRSKLFCWDKPLGQVLLTHAVPSFGWKTQCVRLQSLLGFSLGNSILIKHILNILKPWFPQAQTKCRRLCHQDDSSFRFSPHSSTASILGVICVLCSRCWLINSSSIDDSPMKPPFLDDIPPVKILNPGVRKIFTPFFESIQIRCSISRGVAVKICKWRRPETLCSAYCPWSVEPGRSTQIHHENHHIYIIYIYTQYICILIY